ncbi:MAG: homocysteine S-methyltransferase [Mycobacterium sp.]|nr:homocysteine S-methyltransferase [Mycobacterium sp.]
MARKFPNQQPGLNYLTEGGQETEILYKYGFELQQFAMFPLLDNPRAVTELRGMYGRYLDTAARHGFGVVMGGLDYRASPDWGSLLGYSRESAVDWVPTPPVNSPGVENGDGYCALCPTPHRSFPATAEQNHLVLRHDGHHQRDTRDGHEQTQDV